MYKQDAAMPVASDVKPLLPNEPRVRDWAQEQALTEHFLMPSLPALEALGFEIRARLDPVMRQKQPLKLGKPYPLGQCLEISLAAKRLLQQLDPATLRGAPAQGYAALAAFLRNGGSLRQVWGDLRGQYFQNAFLAGTLYLDVSNDTVVPTKPQVEILPFPKANFSPVQDYAHFARVAASYWKTVVFPNHVVPSLAPYFPLLSAVPSSCVRFESVSDYMITLTQMNGFQPSEAVLSGEPMDRTLFQAVVRCLAGSSFELARDPLQGQALALHYCEKFRAEGARGSGDTGAAAIQAVQEANRQLARLKVR